MLNFNITRARFIAFLISTSLLSRVRILHSPSFMCPGSLTLTGTLNISTLCRQRRSYMARSVLLAVCVTYLPTRAAAFAPGTENSKNFVERLREDLDSLGIPYPRVSSISIPAMGVVKFSWKTELGSLFHAHLKDRILNVQQEQLSDASISGIILKEPKKKIKIAWMDPQYTESEPTESECPVSMGSEYPVPTASEIPSPYSNSANQSEPLSLHQSTPLEEVTSVLIGKRTSRSASPPPPAKRCRSKSPSDDDECSLLHELGSLNEGMKTLATRQTVIREKLKAIGAQSIPEPDFLFRDQFELEIETERKQRIECETVLMDIRRECRVPFIVPALFDAFVDISKLTTAAVDSLH
ncbi:hypothetical protein ARMSODRAFT_960570 [Armillaria solidipes]|uniref:Uncharacterized protein n=1 Tax=Armillaria solidipes TaxID=1076256 RepID=A0A2H3BJC4_9AGAR|nr:hypothetical protein ARMSODRAFT_960570 [Armillaria solidipes]